MSNIKCFWVLASTLKWSKMSLYLHRLGFFCSWTFRSGYDVKLSHQDWYKYLERFRRFNFCLSEPWFRVLFHTSCMNHKMKAPLQRRHLEPPHPWKRTETMKKGFRSFENKINRHQRGNRTKRSFIQEATEQHGGAVRSERSPKGFCGEINKRDDK